MPKFINERTLLQSTINGIQFPTVVILSPVLHHFCTVFMFLTTFKVVNMEELKNRKQKILHNISIQGNYILFCLVVSEIGMQVITNVYN